MTKIEWTDETWNPIAGCNDVSEGCRNCYARGMARRLAAMGSEKYKGLTVLRGSHVVWTGEIHVDEAAMLKPLARVKPTMYFVNSMSDLFHHNVTRATIVRIFAVMMLSPRHRFQVLTKRADRMREIVGAPGFRSDVMKAASEMAFDQEAAGKTFPSNAELVYEAGADDEQECIVRIASAWPLPNVWLGVSVENQRAADDRIPELLETPAAIRFISAEPLLGNVSLLPWLLTQLWVHRDGPCDFKPQPDDYGRCIDWVIAGGESGHGARPMHPAWVRSLRDQCVRNDVPFFFKQWGEWAPFSTSRVDEFLASHPGTSMRSATCLVRNGGSVVRPYGVEDAPGHEMARIGKKAAGDLLDGAQWHQFPEAVHA